MFKKSLDLKVFRKISVLGFKKGAHAYFMKHFTLGIRNSFFIFKIKSKHSNFQKHH